ncbi:MAG: MOSC domain-containing protein [Candidatus Bathyarchaeia archaeon]
MNSERPIGEVRQINVKAEAHGERGLPKRPVDRVLVKRNGLVGDFNRWRHEEAHDDPAMAVLLMPIETIQELNREGWPIKPGDIGENFTTSGIPYGSFAPGKRYKLGRAVIKITKPCDPCSNLYLLPYAGKDKDIVKAIYQRRGWYASVEVEGEAAQGDTIEELRE